MINKLVAAALVAIMVLVAASGAYAADTGEAILKDMGYGAAIGGLLGGAWYLLDDDEGGKKLGLGVGVGIIAGFLVGATDATSAVQIEGGKVKVAMPPVLIDYSAKGTTYSANLLNVRF